MLKKHFISLLKTFSNLISTYGWPGTIFLLLFTFVCKYASSAQKRELIDAYLLGKSNYAITIVLIFIFFTIILKIEKFYSKKRRRIDHNEIKRLSEDKKNQQEGNLNKKLPSST